VEQQPDRRWIILAVFAVIAVGVVVAVLIGQGGGSDDESTAKSGNGKGPDQVLEQGEAATAVVKTSEGTFEIALDTERAPKTTNSFAYLAEKGFYDGLDFHRVAPGFVIQGGDPNGDGTGGPGYSVDEKPPPNLSYTRGVVAMAKSSADPPGRSGSQFFVVTAPDAGLPPEYALLGKVSKGYGTVEKINALGTPQETPKRPILIEEVTIERE